MAKAQESFSFACIRELGDLLGRRRKTKKGKNQVHVTPTNHTGPEKRGDGKANSPQERQVGNLGLEKER